MKPMNQAEVERFIEEAKAYEGCRLQDVKSTEHILALGFYQHSNVYWIVIDLKPALPFVFHASEMPKAMKSKTTPLLLFLRAHFVGHRLKNIQAHTEADRTFILDFSDRTLEIRIFPHGQNAIATTSDKTLSWEKIKLLKEKGVASAYVLRTHEELVQEWQSSNQKKSSAAVNKDKIIQKKKSAVEELKTSLSSDEDVLLKEFGQWLLSHNGEPPEKWKAYYDSQLSHTENAQLVFEKSKKLAHKKEGVQERVDLLLQEIEALESGQAPEPKKKVTSQIIEKSDARAKRFPISEKYELLIGKSGADNLKLLRKAGGHDYWLHLRDYPGSHGILHRNKGQDISDVDMQLAIQRFVKESHAAKHELKKGDPVDVIICECRFVRPIKGDKLGRVNYQNERHLRIRFEA